MQSERYQAGWEKLAEVDGTQGEKVIEALQDIAPDFARMVIEFSFGEIYKREALDLKTREIATIAALAALGNATPQLKVHIHGALNTGSTPQEIVEVMMQMAVYAGFPAALNGLFAAKEVFRELGIDPLSAPMPAHPDSHHQSTLTPGYYVTAEIRMKDPNRADAAKAALIRLCEQTRKEEAGCTLFELHTCPDDPVKLILWERFNSEADFHLHHQAPHTLAYLAQDFTEIVQIHVSDVLN